MKLENLKEKIVKANKDSLLRKEIRLIADVITEIIETKRQWNNIFYTLKENNCQFRI